MLRAISFTFVAMVVTGLLAFDIIASPFTGAARYAYLLLVGAFFYTLIIGLVEHFVPKEAPQQTEVRSKNRARGKTGDAMQTSPQLATVEFATIETDDQVNSLITRLHPDLLLVDEDLENRISTISNLSGFAPTKSAEKRVLILLSDSKLTALRPEKINGTATLLDGQDKVYVFEGASG